MKINRKKLELAKARACMGQKEIVVVGFPVGTLTNAITGKNIKPVSYTHLTLPTTERV